MTGAFSVFGDEAGQPRQACPLPLESKTSLCSFADKKSPATEWGAGQKIGWLRPTKGAL